MNLHTLSRKGLWAMLVFGLVASGCTKGPAESGKTEPGQAASQKQELSVKVPQAGTLNDRVRSLWATTLPIIKADAAGGLSDADYQARRLPLFSAWVTLQQQNANKPKSDDQISRLIPRILELIDHVYGFPGTPVARRIKERQNTGRTDYLIDDIEKQIGELPK